MDDQEFRDRADQALDDLHRRLTAAADKYDFEADLHSGALIIEFDDPPAKFVVSPNAPVKQIWVSAHMKSYKLDWDSVQNTFAVNGQPLADLIVQAISKQLGEEVKL
jgi:iron donor protein CyaY